MENFINCLQKYSNKLVKLSYPIDDSIEWAKLECDASFSTIEQHLEQLNDDNYKKYLFDWSIPINCPELNQVLKLPKIFGNDFFKRLKAGSKFKESWPSLFISPRNITSALHIDALSTHFWMALFIGHKRWTFFKPEDLHLLYPKYVNGMDASFEIDINKPDFDKYPLLKYAQAFVCDLKAGDVLFVPSGSPHQVHSSCCTLAISSNFVDQSNFTEFMRDAHNLESSDEHLKPVLQQLNSQIFDKKMYF